MTRDPFAGGCQTVADRLAVVRTADLATLRLILKRPDLQPSLRRLAEHRCRRLYAEPQRDERRPRTP